MHLPPFARAAATVHLASLGLWAGVVAMTGAAAAVTFPTIKEMRPVVPSLHLNNGEHWLLVGGKAVSSVFQVSHFAQGFLGAVVLLSGLAILATEAAPRNRCRTVWLLSAGLAVGTLAYYLAVLWPRMERNLSDYWGYTAMDKEGVAELAAASQAAFRADHPQSSFVMVSILVLTVIALLSASWTLLSRKVEP